MTTPPTSSLDDLGSTLAEEHDQRHAELLDQLAEDHETIIDLAQRAQDDRRKQRRLQVAAVAALTLIAALAWPALSGSQRHDNPASPRDETLQAAPTSEPYNEAAIYLADLLVEHRDLGGTITLVLARNTVHRFPMAKGDSVTYDAPDELLVSQVNETLFVQATSLGNLSLPVVVHRDRTFTQGDTALIEPALTHDVALGVVVVEANSPRLEGRSSVVERQLTLRPDVRTITFDRLARLPLDHRSKDLQVDRDRERDRLEVRVLAPGQHELHLRHSAFLPALRIGIDARAQDRDTP